MSLEITNLRKWFSEHQETTFADFFKFLQFKTIATDPTYDKDTKECAKWLVSYLNDIGMETEAWETSGQPVVFAKHCKAGKDRPTLLIYQHYDVQPVDPLDLWKSDPFEPTIREGEIYARGAQDNKGQCFYSITAVKALFSLCKEFNFNLKLFIEGEEESGSEGTKDVFTTKAEELKSDYLLVVDAGIPAPGEPAITMGIRGILTGEILCRVAKDDMHSGGFGGIAYNPNRALVNALASLWDDSGKVAVPHFYDDVQKLSKEEAESFDLEVSEEEMRKEFSLCSFSPDPGYSIGESVSIRPTVEINGISGGYAGEGFKTVLPATAVAKVSCRLVPNQDPEKIEKNLTEHLLKQMPEGMDVTITMDHGAPAFRSNPDSLIAKLTAKAYEEVLEKPCKRILTGGSIPITVELAHLTGAEVVIMGYGLDSDQIHAPNEHFGIDRFEQGFLTMGSIFSQLHES